MGNTHGVKIASRPAPKARSRNGMMSCVAAAEAGGGIAPGSWNPAGIATDEAGALGSTVTVEIKLSFRGGRQRVASQTLYLPATVSSAEPPGAAGFRAAS